jgi:ectoine hydroxylase-related dioxygenase (phytanoyl-CoA dioxygenase family)
MTLEREVPHVGAGASAEDVREALARWGAIVVDNVLARGDLEAVESEVAPWFERTPPGEGLFLGQRTRRFSALLTKAPATALMAAHSAVLETVEPLLKGGDAQRCDAIQLGLTQAIAIDPGQRAQVLHRDDSLFPFANDFELLVNAMWPLDPFTRENGGTRFVLQSQHWDRARRPGDEEAVSTVAQPGSVVLWLGSVLHGGGANRSDACRRGLVFQYSLGWLAQAEKLLLTTPPDVVRALPDRLQRLLGYQVHRPNLGWIEERDPIEWLRGTTSDVAAAKDHFTPHMQQQLEAYFGGN